MADENKPENYTVPLTRERSENALVYYCNDAHIQWTKWDVQIAFGQVLAPTISPSGKPSATEAKAIEHVIVVMTKEHLKAMFAALQQVVKTIEATEAKPDQQ